MSLYLMPVGEGRRIPIKKTVVFIGRHPDCDVVLNKSLKVSRRHCCLALVNNKLMVRDLGSTNGVHINGHRIKREEVLRLGDELVIGDVPFILKSRQANNPEANEDTATEIQPANVTNLEDFEEQQKLVDLIDQDEEQDRIELSDASPQKKNSAEASSEDSIQIVPDSEPELQERSIYEMNKDEIQDDRSKYHPEDSSIFK
ncbi:MAG: FHA domain-containing protein [Planctomycetaceae bacterium]|nr:FHA domain-containing protein [Planctomycetaceae bacterium]